MSGQQDRESFPAVVEACYERLFRGALCLTGDRHVAEDIVQETFLSALRKFDSFSGRSSVFTWLYGIMLNKYRNHCRRRRLLKRLGFVRTDTSHTQSQNVGSPDRSPSTSLAKREETELLVKAVGRLPAKLQVVIAMRYFDGLPLNDIAKVLNCHLGTVKSRLTNARKRLYGTLQGRLKRGFENTLPRS